LLFKVIAAFEVFGSANIRHVVHELVAVAAGVDLDGDVRLKRLCRIRG
jgi:hypothetical protein